MPTEIRLAAAAPQSSQPGSMSLDRLRTVVQDSHLNFLIGAGTPSSFFGRLGDIENALTDLEARNLDKDVKTLVRASIQAHFFEKVIEPNLDLLKPGTEANRVLKSYAIFGQTLNRLLLRRRNSLLSKQVNLFTTNIDQVFEVSFERLGVELNDGFSGKIQPTFDMGTFGSLRYRSGVRYEYHSEVPTFNLYKIHGSVGWKMSDTSTRTSDIAFDHDLDNVKRTRDYLNNVQPGLIPISSPEDVNVETLIHQAASQISSQRLDDFNTAYERLVIVNPEKTKFATTVLMETYYELIRRFANELERENSVLFVHGFSFRDEHLRKLVLRAARNNPTLEVIVFCYMPSDQQAYEQLIPELDIPNGNINYVTPPENFEGEAVVFDLDTIVERYFAPLIPEPPRKPDSQIELIFKTHDGENS